jgi:tetratricopeptide (TPR) repeat protein
VPDDDFEDFDEFDEFDEGLMLALHYLQIGNGRQALAALDRVDAAALDEPAYWLLRTSALRDLDRTEEAVEAAKRGLALEPDDAALLHSLGIAELDRDRFTAAERALTAALRLDPEDADLHAHLALTLARRRRYAEARAEVERALVLEPDGISPLRVRAQVAFLAEDDAETVRAYAEDLLRVAPGDQLGHAILGYVSARKKNYTRSARELAGAARLDPGNSGIADGAREARVLAHPILAPVRPIWRFGRWRAYFVYLALFIALAAAHQTLLRLILAGIWITLVVLSRAAPPILRRLERRKYGG